MTCAFVASQAYADDYQWSNGNVWVSNPATTIAELNNSGKPLSFNIWPDQAVAAATADQTLTINRLSLQAGSSVTVSPSPWSTDTNHRVWQEMVIDDIQVANSGSAALTLSTTRPNGGSGAYTPASHPTSLTVSNVSSGSLSGVTVGANTSLVLGSESSAISAKGTMSNNGELTLAGNVQFGGAADAYTQKSGTINWSDAANSQGFRDYSADSVFYAVNGTGTTTTGAGFTSNATADGEGAYVVGVSELDATTTYVVSHSSATLSSSDTARATSYDVSASSAALTVEGGTFNFSKVKSNTTSHVSSLTVEDGATAVLDGGDKSFSGALTVKDGGTVTVGVTDSLNYNVSTETALVVEKGGTLDFGNKRWTVGTNNSLTVGGTVSGVGEARGGQPNYPNGALDFNGNNTIHADGTEGLISATIRARGCTVTFETENEELLTVTGKITNNLGTGNIAKTGNGTLVLSGDNTHKNTTIEAGEVIVKHAHALGEGAVTVKSGATLTIDSGIVAAGYSSVNFESGANAVINGSLALAESNTTLASVTLGEGAVLTLGTVESHAAALTTSAMTVNGDSTINADLVIADGSIVTFNDGAVTLNGTLTIGEGSTIALGTAYHDALEANGQVLVFKGVTNQIDASILESIVVTGDFVSGHLLSVAAGDGTYNIYATPEPATATLSLLALAGLMARRKRH